MVKGSSTLAYGNDSRCLDFLLRAKSRVLNPVKGWLRLANLGLGRADLLGVAGLSQAWVGRERHCLGAQLFVPLAPTTPTFAHTRR